jgi:hypothetical protein
VTQVRNASEAALREDQSGAQDGVVRWRRTQASKVKP